MRHIGTYLQANWDWRAAGNFMFGGSGSGLLTIAGLVALPEAPSPLQVLCGLAFMGAGLGLVWLELGRPLRAINVFFHAETSWMTREAVIAMLCFALALTGIASGVPGLLWTASVAGLAFLYCQGRILQAAKGIPAWRNVASGPLIISTGLAEGAGLLLLLGTITTVGQAWLSYAAIVLFVARALAWVHYRGLLAGERAPAPALAVLKGINVPLLLVGHALPVAVAIAGLATPMQGPVLQALAGALVVVSGWYLKFIIITRAAFVQGYGFGKTKRGVPKFN